MGIKETIERLEAEIKDPKKGLPEDIFRFISRITPMVNVDLLIKNEAGQTLLTWRDDGYYPPSWHVPGGIIRYKETFVDRIRIVAKTELNAEVEFNKTPIAVNEMIQKERETRGHFISFLYECRLLTGPDEDLRYKDGTPEDGQWKWHGVCPDDLISVHRIYRKYI